MMTLSLVELTANARFTMTNPGSNAQNDAPKLRSNPAHVYFGDPDPGRRRHVAQVVQTQRDRQRDA